MTFPNSALAGVFVQPLGTNSTKSLHAIPAQQYSARTNPQATPNGSDWMTEADLDTLLVQRALAGEMQAFDLLVRRYQSKVIAAISRLVRDRTECEDIAQEVFLRVYKNLAGFRGESSFYTWIYRISLNTAKNFLASNGRKIATSELEVDIADQVQDAASLRDRATPEREFLREEISRAVVASMEALPPDIRQALSLREIDGLSYDEIAVRMNCPIGTVRSRIFRAREAIDKQIRPLLEQN
jgi:RNA polymerase sigma-70 factor, ECF subfamily